MERFRKQLLVACTAIVIVISVGAMLGLFALLSAVSQQEHARAIDRQVALTEHLRDAAREVGASARRYMVSGDHKEQQRIAAIEDAMKADRAKLDARNRLEGGPLLEADLDAYMLGITSAIARFESDPIERLSRFEEEIIPARQLLGGAFDSVISHERARRDQLRSTNKLVRGAEWTLVVGGMIGMLLAIGVCVSVLRRLPRGSAPTPPVTGALPARPSLLG